MCETRSCPHEADALCTCRALLERDNDIIGLLTHIHENMTDVEWSWTTQISAGPRSAGCAWWASAASAAAGSARNWTLRTNWPGMISSPPFTGTFIKSTMPEGAICLPGNLEPGLSTCSLSQTRALFEDGLTGLKINIFSGCTAEA